MPYYERNLPHWHPEGAALFLTWRLHGTCAHFTKNKTSSPGQNFLAFDRALDNAVTGPKWLLQAEIARLVMEAIQFGARQLNLYNLHAFCIMPNHVHVVLIPQAPVPKITKSIKGFTARTCNQALGRVGEHFWHDESFDHWARDSDELGRIIRYTERNPVTAGLVDSPEEWTWSSASHCV
ncbi:MAG: transposase [Bryobacteraceae bacterium]